MHQIDGDGYLEDSGNRYFADEDLPTRAATQVTHEWANAVQEEISNVIRSEGISLNDSSETYGQMNQLNTAIHSKLVSGNITNESSAPGTTVTGALNDHESSITANEAGISANTGSITTVNNRLTNHQHGVDGISEVDLSSDVTGQLPFSSVQSHVHTAAMAGLVSLQAHIDSTLNFERQWAQIDYVSPTYTGHFSGFNASPHIVMFLSNTWVGGGGQVRFVKLLIWGCEGNSSSTGFSQTGVITSDYRPFYQPVIFPTMVMSNGLWYPGNVRIGTNGDINVYKNPDSGQDFSHSSSLFSASGLKGYTGGSIEYPVFL